MSPYQDLVSQGHVKSITATMPVFIDNHGCQVVLPLEHIMELRVSLRDPQVRLMPRLMRKELSYGQYHANFAPGR